MTVRIVADSSCDIRSVEGVEFAVSPLTITIEGRDFRDDENLDIPEMLECLDNATEATGTACPSLAEWIRCFEGADEIYVVTISSNLSGTYNSALVAKDMYLQDHPDAKIHVFDSFSTGPEMALLITRLAEYINEGQSFEEVVENGINHLQYSRMFYALSSLQNLARNGRVSKVVANAVSVLGIRLLCTVSTEGTVEPENKVRGEKRVPAKIVESLKKASYTDGRVFLCHVDNPKLADAIAAAITKEFGTTPLIYPAGGLVSYYAERNAVLVACECNVTYG